MLAQKARLFRLIGIVGALTCLVLFLSHPSFPTPDKLFVILFFLFMAFNQGWEFTKRLLPFVLIILIYESFRSVADKLNSHVHYQFAPHFDKFLFGNLPTVDLQRWWWHGYVQWYDVALYIPYLLFFIVPLGVAVLVWKTREHYYWQTVSAYSILFFSAFVTFLVLPTAPPWLASQNHQIQPIVRISSNVWASLGIKNFPSLYSHLAPNPVAAFPSLHAGVATLSSLIIFKLFGRRWGTLSLIYPILIYIGVIYEGEHYATDVLAGILYGLVAYCVAPYLMSGFNKLFRQLRSKYSSSTKTFLKLEQ